LFWFNTECELEIVIIPILFPIGKGECVMFTRKLESGSFVYRTDDLTATAVLFVLALGLVAKTETGETAAKNHYKTALITA